MLTTFVSFSSSFVVHIELTFFFFFNPSIEEGHGMKDTGTEAERDTVR